MHINAILKSLISNKLEKLKLETDKNIFVLFINSCTTWINVMGQYIQPLALKVKCRTLNSTGYIDGVRGVGQKYYSVQKWFQTVLLYKERLAKRTAFTQLLIPFIYTLLPFN